MCELRGDQANLAAHLNITGIEEAPAQNEKPPNRLVTLRHPNEVHDPLDAIGNHAHGKFAASSYLNHIRNGLDGLQVFQCYFITEWLRLFRPLKQPRPTQRGAPPPDLRKPALA